MTEYEALELNDEQSQVCSSRTNMAKIRVECKEYRLWLVLGLALGLCLAKQSALYCSLLVEHSGTYSLYLR